MRALLLLGVGLLALPIGAPAAEIYRCDQDGVVEFSDQPCQSDATPYLSSGSISVIEPDQGLTAIQQQSQYWLERHRERQSQRARTRAARNLTAIRSAPTPAPEPVGVPLPWAWNPPLYRPPAAPPPAVFEPSPQRYSALSGPFPGTRRRESDDSMTSDPR